jgi:hypothetical protein
VLFRILYPCRLLLQAVKTRITPLLKLHQLMMRT